MFRSTPAATAPPPPVRDVASDPVPLSQLGLDLPEPPTGWSAFLAGRNIPTELDDIGRWCVSRATARELLTEQREQQEAANRMRAELERLAVERDQQFRASLNPGIPWYLIGRDVTPAAALLEAQQDAEYAGRPRSVAAELLEAELDGAGNTMVFHSLAPESDES